MQYVYQVWLDVKLFLFSEPLPCQTSLNEMLNEITKVKNTYPIEKATGKLSKQIFHHSIATDLLLSPAE